MKPNYTKQLNELDKVAQALRLDYTVSKRELLDAVRRFASVANVDLVDLVTIVDISDIRDEVDA